MLGLYAITSGSHVLGELFIPTEINEHWAAKAFRISNLSGFIGPLVVIVITGQTLKEHSISWTTIGQALRPILVPALLINLIFIAGSLIEGWSGPLTSSGIAPPMILLIAKMGFSLVVMILEIYFTFTYQALVFNGQRGVSAFIFSFQAVRGSWWKLFAARTLFVLPFMIFFIPMHLFCDPELLLEVYYPISNQLLGPFFAVLAGYISIFYTLFFLNIIRHDVRFSETPADEVPD